MGQMTRTYKILPGKPEGKRPSVGPGRILEDSIKTDLREIECDDTDKMHFKSIIFWDMTPCSP
jgi:hypothetical protein